MNRESAIQEIGWYRHLVSRRLADWGRDLEPRYRNMLLSNIDDVVECGAAVEYKEYENGYYIGQVDEDGLRHGSGIFTRTTDNRDRWVMQAGEWNEERATGVHTLYDADCPEGQHYIAALYFTGNRRRESGLVQLSVSVHGIDFRERKYRRWEGFSFSTLLVGGLMIYVFLLATIRNAKLALVVVGFIAALYILGSLRGRQ